MISKKNYARLTAVLFSIVLCGCVTEKYPLAMPSDWSIDEHWYQDNIPACEDKVDVFYVAATDIISSTTPDGKKSPLAVLTREECDTIAAECDWFRKNIFTQEFNFYAPIYHQVTFESLGQPRGGRNELWDAAADDVCKAFDTYMASHNGGRRFILAGFSQGASILRALLKHMTDEQYSRCVAAYAIGFQLTEDDLKSPHIRPAKGAADQGVVISFNSVSKLTGALPLLSGDAVCSINPVNWRTDSEPAVFEYKGQKLTASLDTDKHLVIVKGFPESKTAFSGFFPEGNLHVYDRVMYIKPIHDNAVLRAYGEK